MLRTRAIFGRSNTSINEYYFPKHWKPHALPICYRYFGAPDALCTCEAKIPSRTNEAPEQGHHSPEFRGKQGRTLRGGGCARCIANLRMLRKINNGSRGMRRLRRRDRVGGRASASQPRSRHHRPARTDKKGSAPDLADVRRCTLAGVNRLYRITSNSAILKRSVWTTIGPIRHCPGRAREWPDQHGNPN